jgi:hypothetical protein
LGTSGPLYVIMVEGRRETVPGSSLFPHKAAGGDWAGDSSDPHGGSGAAAPPGAVALPPRDTPPRGEGPPVGHESLLAHHRVSATPAAAAAPATHSPPGQGATQPGLACSSCLTTLCPKERLRCPWGHALAATAFLCSHCSSSSLLISTLLTLLIRAGLLRACAVLACVVAVCYVLLMCFMWRGMCGWSLRVSVSCALCDARVRLVVWLLRAGVSHV